MRTGFMISGTCGALVLENYASPDCSGSPYFEQQLGESGSCTQLGSASVMATCNAPAQSVAAAGGWTTMTIGMVAGGAALVGAAAIFIIHRRRTGPRRGDFERARTRTTSDFNGKNPMHPSSRTAAGKEGALPDTPTPASADSNTIIHPTRTQITEI